MSDALPDSKTHRLCFFTGSTTPSKHETVPHCVADEVEELRAFIHFLFPQRGQDRFKLHRPDILDPRWSVYSRDEDGISRSYAAGDTPRHAVVNARARLAAEPPAYIPFALETQKQPE